MLPIEGTSPISGSMEQSSTPTVVQLNATGFPAVQSQPGEAERRAEGVQSPHGRLPCRFSRSVGAGDREFCGQGGRACRQGTCGGDFSDATVDVAACRVFAFPFQDSVPPGESTQLAENIETTGFSGTVAIARPAALAASMVNGTGSSGDGMRMGPFGWHRPDSPVDRRGVGPFRAPGQFDFASGIHAGGRLYRKFDRRHVGRIHLEYLRVLAATAVFHPDFHMMPSALAASGGSIGAGRRTDPVPFLGILRDGEDEAVQVRIVGLDSVAVGLPESRGLRRRRQDFGENRFCPDASGSPFCRLGLWSRRRLPG